VSMSRAPSWMVRTCWAAAKWACLRSSLSPVAVGMSLCASSCCLPAKHPRAALDLPVGSLRLRATSKAEWDAASRCPTSLRLGAVACDSRSNFLRRKRLPPDTNYAAWSALRDSWLDHPPEKRHRTVRPIPLRFVIENPASRWGLMSGVGGVVLGVVVARRQVQPPRRTIGVIPPTRGETASEGTSRCRHTARCSARRHRPRCRRSLMAGEPYRLAGRCRPLPSAALVEARLLAAVLMLWLVMTPGACSKCRWARQLSSAVVTICVACMQRR
jgi:hypothetical protein